MKEGTALARLISKIRACKDKVTRKSKEKKKKKPIQTLYLKLNCLKK